MGLFNLFKKKDALSKDIESKEVKSNLKEIGENYKEVLKDKSKNNESIIIMLFRLNQSIDKFNEVSSKYSKIIIFLTVVMILLIIVQIISII